MAAQPAPATAAADALAGAGPARALGRVAVLGPGGVGGLLAGLLARAGCQVVCLAGAATAAVLAARGVSVRSGVFGEFTAAVRAAERLPAPVDLCLVTVKATQLDAALERLPAHLLAGALVVPLLNGVEHPGLLRSRYPEAHVVAATIRVESTRVHPGEVVHASPFAEVVLPAATDAPAPGVPALAELLRAAGLQVHLGGGEHEVLWTKLAFLAPLALLTTHAQAPIGVARTQRHEDLVALVGEAVAVGQAEGAPLDAERVLALLEGLPAGMRSSMQRDAAAGAPLELEAIGGAVLRAAARHRLAVPVTTRLVADLRARERARTAR